MPHRSRPAGTLGLAVLLVGLGAQPARGATISLSLPERHHLLDRGLTPASLPEGSTTPIIHPMIGEAAAGLGAGLITIPLMLLLGTALQNDSPNFLVAGLPPILLFVAVPAVGVSFSEWFAGRALGADVHVQPAVYVALGVQLLAYLGGAFGGVGPRNFASMAIFSVIDAVVLSGAVFGTMQLQAALSAPPKAAAPPEPIQPAVAPATERAPSSSAPATTGFTLFAGAF